MEAFSFVLAMMVCASMGLFFCGDLERGDGVGFMLSVSLIVVSVISVLESLRVVSITSFVLFRSVLDISCDTSYVVVLVTAVVGSL